MKAKELRELTDAEIQQRLDDLVKERFNLRIQKSTAQLEKPSRIREVRREIARLKTVVTERKKVAK